MLELKNLKQKNRFKYKINFFIIISILIKPKKILYVYNKQIKNIIHKIDDDAYVF